MYLLLDKFLFLHLPRTGSTSLIYSMLDTDKNFSPVFDDFSPAVMAKYNPKERYDMHYSMAVIRNLGIEKLVCGVGPSRNTRRCANGF